MPAKVSKLVVSESIATLIESTNYVTVIVFLRALFMKITIRACHKQLLNTDRMIWADMYEYIQSREYGHFMRDRAAPVLQLDYTYLGGRFA